MSGHLTDGLLSRSFASLRAFALLGSRPVGEALAALDKRPVGLRPTRPVLVRLGLGTLGGPAGRRPAGAAPGE
ncbi:MAG TPA: hypothetical protein VHJ83_13400 [Micromonosporaceae bacterium]|nr:hypothetical protein [Micromonosporaceae bacterium]